MKNAGSTRSGKIVVNLDEIINLPQDLHGEDEDYSSFIYKKLYWFDDELRKNRPRILRCVSGKFLLFSLICFFFFLNFFFKQCDITS